ncbi:thiol reductant ABC exporter subunit CydD [Candidimonas nitroreducens]|uniref:Thiol reductant ABC exporter subunit CydD n=1 Tax=Candidimonas nitroreducens TaxID=683354 RepID=A0A225MHP5_9BURK|nr:thiol reductant ABC exporter subunit CydD [Candidimonas nitroreducens]OWT59031.1 thiol reductant ABC exporter subunit CydD [Candidimonas nitroreducens]
MAEPDGGTQAAAGARPAARWLAALARLPRAAMAWAVAAPLLAGLLLLPQAWWLARVLGGSVAGSGPAAAGPWIAAIGGMVALRAAIAWSGERAASRAAETIKSWLRRKLFAAMLSRGPQWTRQKASGELSSLVIEQVEALDGYFSRYLPGAIAAVFLPLAFGLVLLPVDWIVALIALLSAPLIPVFMALVGWGAEAASRRHQLAMARLSGFFADRVRGAQTLKLLGRAESETAAVGAASADLSRKTMAVLRIAFLSSAVLEFFAALGVAGVALYVGLGYLGYLHLRSEALGLPLGLFCLLMAPEIYNPLRQFAANYHDRAAARAAVDCLAAVFGALPDPRRRRAPAAGPAASAAQSLPEHEAARVTCEQAPRPEAFQPEALSTGASLRAAAGTTGAPYAAGGSSAESPSGNEQAAPRPLAVEVRGACLQVPGRAQPVLCDLSWSLAPGASLALMGHSGAGKTTLLEALAGLRPLDTGAILLDGRGLDIWPADELRRAVTLIGQRPFVLPGSVADNLRVADPAATAEDLLGALDAACAGEFVRALPQGMDTQLGLQGYGLSGGQLQRLALARLFLTRPGLILLDEPTASLDPHSRDRVMDNVLRFAAGRTLIVATHDPEVSARLDGSLVLPQGGGQA